MGEECVDNGDRGSQRYSAFSMFSNYTPVTWKVYNTAPMTLKNICSIVNEMGKNETIPSTTYSFYKSPPLTLYMQLLTTLWVSDTRRGPVHVCMQKHVTPTHVCMCVWSYQLRRTATVMINTLCFGASDLKEAGESEASR